MATAFDLKQLRPSGTAIALLENVAFSYFILNISKNGTLIYLPDPTSNSYELVWVDMNGVIQSTINGTKIIWGPRISPDGEKIAMWVPGQSGGHVYIYDLARESFERLTNTYENFWPVWTPDGKYVAFPSIRPGPPNLYWKPIDNSTSTEAMMKDEIAEKMSDYFFQPQMWTSDGRFLIFVRIRDAKSDIMFMDMDNDNQISEFISTDNDERLPRISPDNQWLAYQSDESNKFEIYITKFPEKGAKWKISSDGGTEPIWSPDGNRIYYRHGDQFMAVDVETRSAFHAGKPEILFSGKFRQSIFGWFYDLHPKGDRFVMVKEEKSDSLFNQIYLIRNFPEEIKSKIASNR